MFWLRFIFVVLVASAAVRSSIRALSIGVSSPEDELKKASLVVIGKAYQGIGEVYFKPERVLKGNLDLTKTYGVRSSSVNDQFEPMCRQSLINSSKGERFILLGAKYIDEKGSVYVYPTNFGWSVWPQGMKDSDNFPYKTIVDCLRFIERRMKVEKQMQIEEQRRI